MKYIIKGRAGGKTTELVGETIKNNGIMIVMNLQERDRILRLYPNIKPEQIISWREKNKLIGNHNKFYLDNAEILLQEIFGYGLKAMSMTGEVLEIGNRLFDRKAR